MSWTSRTPHRIDFEDKTLEIDDNPMPLHVGDALSLVPYDLELDYSVAHGWELGYLLHEDEYSMYGTVVEAEGNRVTVSIEAFAEWDGGDDVYVCWQIERAPSLAILQGRHRRNTLSDWWQEAQQNWQETYEAQRHLAKAANSYWDHAKAYWWKQELARREEELALEALGRLFRSQRQVLMGYDPDLTYQAAERAPRQILYPVSQRVTFYDLTRAPVEKATFQRTLEEMNAVIADQPDEIYESLRLAALQGGVNLNLNSAVLAGRIGKNGCLS